MSETLKTTPLTALHESLGGKMVPFAGHLMPLQFDGIVAEHSHCRSAAGLFDVSHMGQVVVRAKDGGDPAEALERLVSQKLTNMKPGRVRYALLLNENGGIVDDLMVTRRAGDELYLVINAARRQVDLAYLAQALGSELALEPLDGRALIALQGPQAEAALDAVLPGVAALGFMQAEECVPFGEGFVAVSRSGYTGEDGYEISVAADQAEALTEKLISHDMVKPIGLGARDSLRLEAGLCLYGHDLDETVSPVEADLMFALPKSRREAADFPGADRILTEWRQGPTRRRVGLKPDGRQIAREGAAIVDPESGETLGTVTSGSFGPSVGGPVAMGYVPPAFAEEGRPVHLMVRNKPVPARIAALPFQSHRYKRKA